MTRECTDPMQCLCDRRPSVALLLPLALILGLVVALPLPLPLPLTPCNASAPGALRE